MSNKAECPACKAWLSGVYDAMEGVREGCPSCGLPGSVIREIDAARKKHADAELTRKLEEALLRAGKAEAALRAIRKRAYAARQAFNEWEQEDPLASGDWQQASHDWD